MPPELEINLKNSKFKTRFKQMIDKNFPFEHYINNRYFENLYYYDQYKLKHLLPTFLSKITPPDSTFIEFDPK